MTNISIHSNISVQSPKTGINKRECMINYWLIKRVCFVNARLNSTTYLTFFKISDRLDSYFFLSVAKGLPTIA